MSDESTKGVHPMNVWEIIWAIEINYPDIKVWEDDSENRSPDWNSFRLDLPNGWRISCGYGKSHFAGNGAIPLEYPKDSTLLEIALFNPQGEWHIAEGMTNITKYEDGTKAGVLTFQNSDQLFRIIDYLTALDPKPP